MSPFVQFGIQAALVVLVILMIPCVYRFYVGPSAADRLQAIDAVTTLLIGVIIVLALLRDTAMFIDVGIAIAAFSFIGTIALARYISEGKAF